MAAVRPALICKSQPTFFCQQTPRHTAEAFLAASAFRPGAVNIKNSKRVLRPCEPAPTGVTGDDSNTPLLCSSQLAPANLKQTLNLAERTIRPPLEPNKCAHDCPPRMLRPIRRSAAIGRWFSSTLRLVANKNGVILGKSALTRKRTFAALRNARASGLVARYAQRSSGTCCAAGVLRVCPACGRMPL